MFQAARGPTVPRLGDQLIGDQLCPRLQCVTAAPGIVRPLRLLQIIEIAAADFRVLLRESEFAVQSMSSKTNARQQPKNLETRENFTQRPAYEGLGLQIALLSAN